MSFCELCTHSYYSFLDGCSSPEELVEAASEQGMTSLALTDRNGLYGVIPFYHACKEKGIKPVIGAELTLEDGDSVTVLCRNQTGYQRLSTLITRAFSGREKGDAQLERSALPAADEELFYLIGGKGSHLHALVARNDLESARLYLQPFLEQLGQSSVLLVLSDHFDQGDAAVVRRLTQLASEYDLKCIVSNLPRYATPERARLYDVLCCIRQGVTLDDSHHQRVGNQERYLKQAEQLRERFPDYPDAIQATQWVADQCNVDLDFSAYRFPEYAVPQPHTTHSYLRWLCEQRLPGRYSAECPIARGRLKQELDLIEELDLSGYFLVVWDLMEFARSKCIPAQGRGSAANSVVAYVLGITPVDPIAHNLFLGRFLHSGMKTIPDIDIDFASSRDTGKADREDVIQYVYHKYGHDHVAMVCTFVTFQPRMAIREVGKVMQMPEPILARMARIAGRGGVEGALQELLQIPEFAQTLQQSRWRLFCEMVDAIADLPRHPSIHVGGMLIASEPLAHIVPLEPARMEGRVVCQWDKDMVEDAGLIKVDILGLGMLSVLRESAELLEAELGERVDLTAIPDDDPSVYAMIAQADTVGMFQVESRAQMQSLPRTRPHNFAELGIQVAIIRPGPLQGNMVAPYIARKQGKEPVVHLHPKVAPILDETLGVILFQEQVLQVAVAVASFTSSEAEELRRAMSRKRSTLTMQRLKQRYLEGAADNGISAEQAERIFATLEGFALYGFCKSHALSFARITYVSAWLKRYHPAAFLAALLNNQPMGFYSSETLIEDGKRHGVQVLPVCVQHSRYRCSLEEGAVRLGLKLVKGISEEIAQKISTHAPFHCLRDLLRRTGANGRQMQALIGAGACDSWQLERRELLWQLWLFNKEGDEPTLFELPTAQPVLPIADAWERMGEEWDLLGHSPQGHPMELLRREGRVRDVLTAAELATANDDSWVEVAGLVICRQKPPTAKGFMFLTLEDETGMMNIVIQPQLYERCRTTLRTDPLLVVKGKVERVDSVTNLKATMVRPCAWSHS